MEDHPLAERRFVWLGGEPVHEPAARRTRLILPGRTSDYSVTVSTRQAEWLGELIRRSTPQNRSSSSYPWLRETGTTYPGTAQEFETFLGTPAWRKVRSAGLLLV